MTELPLHALAPAKINLGLALGPLTGDGRHELVSVMQSISLADELVLDWASDSAARADEVICPGVEGPEEENLAARALASFRRETGWDAPALRLTVAKRVPVAAGLGGGSGDAAAVLRLAARASGIEDAPLLALAIALGSDVPAQVRPGRWLASGTGERLVELPAPSPAFGVLVLPMATPLSTAAVYAEADRLALARDRDELSRYHEALNDTLRAGAPLPPRELLVNDLEAAARSLCPAIDTSLATVRASGADVTLVSGSGPTVLGLFAGKEGPTRAREAAEQIARGDSSGRAAPAAALPADAPFAEPGALLSQFPGAP